MFNRKYYSIEYPPIIIVSLDIDYCDHTHHLGADDNNNSNSIIEER